MVPYITGITWHMFGEAPWLLMFMNAMCMIFPLLIVYFIPGMTYQFDLGKERFLAMRKLSSFHYHDMSFKNLRGSVDMIISKNRLKHRSQKIVKDLEGTGLGQSYGTNQ